MFSLTCPVLHDDRCIKPNQSLTAGHFDRDLVRVQLRHSGLVEVAMVRKYGYPIRIKFSDFVERYEQEAGNDSLKGMSYMMCFCRAQ